MHSAQCDECQKVLALEVLGTVGDEAQATYYVVEAKTKQIEAIKLATQIKNLELARTRRASRFRLPP